MQALSESEQQIMQWVWQTAGPVTTAGVMDACSPRGWKSQTVNTFLARLVEKGFLSVCRKGPQNQYSAAISADAYRAEQTKSFLVQMHDGSVRSMIAALCDADGLQSDELALLRRWLEER